MNDTTCTNSLPLGKLPLQLLEQLLARAPISDPRVLLGPGIGMDCAVVDMGSTLLVFKTDPITFASDEIGWYCVQVCANDIATTGAAARWMLTTLLMPGGKTCETDVTAVTEQLYHACQSLNISLIGGHTEITYGIDHPLLIGTMIGEVSHANLITPQGAGIGDRILLTKGIPIEAAAILAREFPEELKTILTAEELRKAADYLYLPGIGITRDAQIACKAGRVTAMHDPTEGGLAAALWELSQASKAALVIQREKIPVPPLADRICRHFHLDPIASIASGALLMTAAASDAARIIEQLQAGGILCADIGSITADPQGVWELAGGERTALPRPPRDEIARFFEEHKST